MQTEASFIIRNARVLTMDDANPRAAALAVSANRILAVGSEAQIDAYSGPDTHVIDAKGATVLPGFNEAHMHIFGGSAELRELSLMGVKGFDALSAALKAYAADYPQRAVLIAQHADYTILSDDERVTRHHLDRILPDRAVLIFAPDHHTAWANTLALKMGGILEGRDVGIGNEIVMGEDGLANGELRESNAIRPVSALSETGGREMLGVGTGGDPEHVTAEERAADIEILKEGLAYVASLGITSLQNMDGSLYQLEMLDEIEKTTGLPVRVRMPFHMKNFMPLSDIEAKAAAWRKRFNTDRLRSDFVKLFMDGVTESGTAVFVDDYSHQPGWKGDPLFSQESFDAIAIAADKLGLPVAVHAIGDGAVRMVLNGYEAAIEANGKRDSRNRIEHIEVVHPDDIPRFKQLGTVASMQPTHPPGSAGLPLEPYLSYIGEERWPYAFAWRTLTDAGAPIVFATDWPVSPLDPMHCIECAMTRTVWKGGMKDERLSLHETLAAYTKNGAWVEFMEDRKGVLKPGYLADIVVLSADVETADFGDLAKIRPVTTICDGRITYQA
ncbi:amidohydrolase [Shinella zoogloeoides]|uniref:amidohydrolase n=1 Tax=Shinella zoogloeoides TaxID=352475 RepID=UPI001F5AFE19|nr:amidohydrolase [Shinella zoogloeoides]